jgi:hypothetical protein
MCEPRTGNADPFLTENEDEQPTTNGTRLLLRRRKETLPQVRELPQPLPGPESKKGGVMEITPINLEFLQAIFAKFDFVAKWDEYADGVNIAPSKFPNDSEYTIYFDKAVGYSAVHWTQTGGSYYEPPDATETEIGTSSHPGGIAKTVLEHEAAMRIGLTIDCISEEFQDREYAKINADRTAGIIQY